MAHMSPLVRGSLIPTRPGAREAASTSFILPVDKRNNNWSSLVNGITFPSVVVCFFPPRDNSYRRDGVTTAANVSMSDGGLCSAMPRLLPGEQGARSTVSPRLEWLGETPVSDARTPRLQMRFHR